MVESLMIFTLGALAALLAFLIFLPAFSRRAERLARRRVEDTYPLSLAEIAAERDHMRANLALDARKAEMRAEEIAQARAEDMAELGRRAVALHALENSLTAKDAAISRLESDLAMSRGETAATIATLEETRGVLAETGRRLGDLAAVHEASERTQSATAAELETARAELATAGARVSELREQHSAREAAIQRLSDDHQRVSALATERRLELDTMAASLASLERQRADFDRRLAIAADVGTERAHVISELTHKLAERDARLALALRKVADAEAAETQANERAAAAAREKSAAGETAARLGHDTREMELVVARARADEARQRARIAELERELSDLRETGDQRIKPLAQRAETLTAERGALEAALATSRAEHDRLHLEIAALKRKLADGAQRVVRENAVLRRHIEEVADRIMNTPPMPTEPKQPAARVKREGGRPRAGSRATPSTAREPERAVER